MENIKGLVLKSINYKESSKIIYVYTKDGLKSVLIHGNNKMKNRYLNISRTLNYIDVFATGKEMLTFRDGDILKGYRKIADNLEKYTYSTHISELVYSFSSHQHNHEKLLNFLLKILDVVNEVDNYIPYLNTIELKLLYLLGVNPMFNHCVSCDETNNLVFSIAEGGYCCPEHIKNPDRFSVSTLNYIKYLYYFDLAKDKMVEIDESNLKQIRIFLDRYYAYHQNIKTNSRQLLMGLIGY